MAKLYPPIIEGKIPAQSGAVLKIPFRFNRSVSANQVGCVIARIKTVSTNLWKGTVPELNDDVLVALENGAYNNYGPDSQGSYYTNISLNGTGIVLEPGQYYKIQLAFCSPDGVLGYYSSIGIFKYTTRASVYIEGLDALQDEVNGNLYDYIGKYSQSAVNGDITEKAYSYRFDIYRVSDNSLIASSGEQIHDNSKDESAGWSQDYYELETSLQDNENYQIQYTVTTINGLVLESPKYSIVANDFLSNSIPGKLIAENDFENGRVNLTHEGNQWLVPSAYGFVISRSSATSGFTVWRDIYKFSVDKGGAFPSDLGADYTVEQGETYKYAVQFYQPTGLRSQRKETEVVKVDFEDIFLYDGDRQLRVRFNPKVNSFKTTTLETKVDTIGGPYPYFFRNGNVSYKEFPVSGLISYLMDDGENFMSNAELGFIDTNAIYRANGIHYEGHEFKFEDEYWIGDERFLKENHSFRDSSLSSQNFKAERLFKIQALNWLNNGKPKLFRSPTEGNYIIRLMNVSLSPSEQISRMLHTFSSTAYEIAECTYKNMVDYGFVPERRYDNQILLYMTDDIAATKKISAGKWTKSFTAEGGIYKAELREVKPGTVFEVWYKDDQQSQTIMVGATGIYTFNIYDTPIISINLLSDQFDTGGYFDYGYYTTGDIADFSKVHNVYYSMQTIDYAQPYGHSSTSLFDHYQNCKQKINYIYVLKLEERRIQTVYKKDDKYYTDPEYLYETDVNSHDTLYHVWGTNDYIDGYTKMPIATTAPDYYYEIEFKDGRTSTIDISGPSEIIYHSLNTIKDIHLGNGVYATGTYQQIEYLYGVEIDGSNPTIQAAYNNYVEKKVAFNANPTEDNEAAVEEALDQLNNLLVEYGYGEEV